MNLSTAIFLVNKSVRSVKITYDPDVPKHNNPDRNFKTLDPDLAVDDYVIVPTNTRHGFTVCKVAAIDFVVNFDSPTEYAWIVGKVDKSAFDQLVAQEAVVLDRVARAEENRKRKELADALGLDDVSLTDLDVVRGNIKLAAPSTPRGAAEVEAAPSGEVAPEDSII